MSIDTLVSVSVDEQKTITTTYLQGKTDSNEVSILERLFIKSPTGTKSADGNYFQQLN